MADAVAMQPVRCVAPCASPFESRTRMGQSRMFSASHRGRFTRKRSAVRQPGMPQGTVVGLARATWMELVRSKGRFHAVGSARPRRPSDLQQERRLGASAYCWRWKAGGAYTWRHNRGIASGKTALKALLLLFLMHTHHAPRTPYDHMDRINGCPFADGS
jgi:hypothetical protein